VSWVKLITDFNYKRNVGGAIGFYIFYLVSSLILVIVAGALVGRGRSVEEAQRLAAVIGRVAGMAIPIVLALLISWSKKIYKKVVAIVSVVLTVLLTLFGGIFLSLIPVAFLTTVKPQKKA